MVTHLAGKPQTPTAQGSRQKTPCNKAQDLYANRVTEPHVVVRLVPMGRGFGQTKPTKSLVICSLLRIC